MNTRPSIVVVDDFVPNPDALREFALRQDFVDSGSSYGKRTPAPFLQFFEQSVFERLLGRKIIRWHEHDMNGRFQICTAETPIVYHTDAQTHAGTLYLTPDAPPEAGLSLWRSKCNGSRRGAASDEDNAIMFGGFMDRTKWELVDRIGNVYNRLVLWDGSLIHSASNYFGTNKENCRLFAMFFFDCE
jgi:hypothetical protein